MRSLNSKRVALLSSFRHTFTFATPEELSKHVDCIAVREPMLGDGYYLHRFPLLPKCLVIAV